MNVVMLGPFGLRPKGTMSARALPMAKALAAKGHQVTVLIPPWDHPTDSGKLWQQDGIAVVNLALPSALPGWFQIRLTGRLVRQALELHPDIIHFFKPKAYAGLSHWLVSALRDLHLAAPELRLIVDEDDWERAWNQVAPYSAAQKWFFAWQERWGLRNADAVVVASLELKRLVTAEGVAAERTFYVPNGVWPTSIEKRSDRSQPVRTAWDLDNLPVILLYSRFFEFRLERIVTIMRRVSARQPSARLLIVGEGLFGQEAELADRLRVAGLTDAVRFSGWVPADRLPHYFAAADVAVFPLDDTPINRTKCSVKLTELLASGLPVVADAVGQSTEYIVDGQSGCLVPPGDDAAFADAVLALLEDAGMREQLGAAAAQRIQKEFAWPRLAAEVEKAYHA
jgi:glycosyltransferase involved in cell wall biosynthesis